MLSYSWLFLCCLPAVALSLEEDQPATLPQSPSEPLIRPTQAVMESEAPPQQSHSGDVAHTRTDSLPRSSMPLDRLSVSPLDAKRNRQRKLKGGQRRRNSQVDQAKATFSQVRGRLSGQTDLTRIADSDPADQTKPGGSLPTTHPDTRDQGVPGDSVKTGVSIPRSRTHTGFGSPLDRIGIGRFSNRKG